MSKPVGTVVLARLLAEALQADRAFQAVAKEFYGRSWTVECGFDRRRMEWTQVCPFAVLIPGGTVYPAGMPRVEHEIGLALGVNDKTFDFELRGMAFLGEKAWQAAWESIENALSLLPGISIAETRLEFAQESHPLLYLNAAFSIHESLPVGRR